MSSEGIQAQEATFKVPLTATEDNQFASDDIKAQDMNTHTQNGTLKVNLEPMNKQTIEHLSILPTTNEVNQKQAFFRGQIDIPIDEKNTKERQKMQLSQQQRSSELSQSKIQPLQASRSQKKQKFAIRQNLNGSLLRKQEPKSDRKTINLQEVEQKIKEIAKEIRSKVKKDGHKQKKTKGMDAVKSKSRYRKDVILTPLKNVDVSRGFMMTAPQDLNIKLPQKMTNQENKVIQLQISAEKIVKNMLKKQILDKVFKKIEEQSKKNKFKLKLDPLKHHYPMTSFRRSVLLEEKSLHMKDLKKQRQKQEKLLQRKLIFNSSRYQRYANPINKQFKEETSYVQKGVTTSKVFTVDQHEQNPQKGAQPFQLEDPSLVTVAQQSKKTQQEDIKQDTKPEFKKTQVAASIAQLDGLIKNMLESNENPLKKEQSNPSEKEKHVENGSSQWEADLI